MASIMGEIDDKDVLDPRDLEELYSWIDVAPLSRPKKHISRDFSDGVSVAEIVQFYMPRMVELHNYVNANSTSQKRINWSMLNRKVFVKLNMKLSEKTIDNVIEAKPGAIEQVLWDLRKKVLDVSPKTSSKSSTGSQLGKGSAAGYAEGKISKRTSGIISTSMSTRIPTTKSRQAPVTGRRRSVSPAPANASLDKSGGLSYSAGLKDELTQFGNNVISSNNSPKSKSETATLQQASAVIGGVDANANPGNLDPTSLPPAHLIYKGHKMVPSMLLDIKNRQIRDLESVVHGLQKKVNFLDNLIQLKDNRVEDLSRQLHTLKTKFQGLAQANIPDL